MEGAVEALRGMGDEESFPVTLRVYDLSLGMAKTMSMQVRGGAQACARGCVLGARGCELHMAGAGCCTQLGSWGGRVRVWGGRCPAVELERTGGCVWR